MKRKVKKVEKIMDLETIYSEIQKNEYDFLLFHPELNDNKDIVLEIIKVDSNSLRLVSSRLKNDREVVLSAVSKDGKSLLYASKELKDDDEIVLEAIKQNSWALKYASKRLQELLGNSNRKSLQGVSEFLKIGSKIIKQNEIIYKDYDFVLKAVKHNGLALQHVSKVFKRDRNIVLEAVKQNGTAFIYINDELKLDREILLESIKNNSKMFHYVPKEFKNNKSFLLEVIQYQSHCFRMFSKIFRDDKDIGLLAVKDRNNFIFLSESLKLDVDILFVLSKKWDILNSRMSNLYQIKFYWK
jgi:hypothetical protein